MEKLCWVLFGVSVLWVSGMLCLPVQPEVLPSHNRTLRETQCYEDEYSSQEICCQKCPAGTYVADHCTENHQRGSCQPCSAGQDYLASPSGFEACLTCLVCRLDQVQVYACTPKSDTVCQCKPGTYCIPGDVCEICNKCSRCGKGKRVKEECTATKNTVCEEDIPITQPTSNTTSSYLLPKDLTKIVSSTPKTDVIKPLNSTPDKDVPKDPDPKNDNDNQPTNIFLVPFIISAVITSSIIVVGGGWCFYKKTREKQNQNLLANYSTDPSASSSLQSTPIADRANQGVPQQPPLEAVPLLGSCNAMDPSNGVTEPTEPSSTQGPQSSEDPGPGGDDSGGGGGGATQDDEPCTHCNLLQPCNCYWTSCFHRIIDHVGIEYIVRLARDLRVPNNTIDCIIKDNPNNTYEQCYKLLERWRTLTGKQASMESVFSALRSMELGGCVENIINSLRSENISII